MTNSAQLEDIETRLMHFEASLDQITRTLLDQDRIIAEQAEQIRQLEQQVRALTPSHLADASEETPPPHY